MAVQQILDKDFKFINQELIHGVKSGNSLALGGATSTADSQIVLQSGGEHTIQPTETAGFFVDPIRTTTDGDGLMNVIYDSSGSEFRLINGNGGGGGSSAGHNNSTDTSVALGKDSSQTAVNQIIIQSGTNTIDAPVQEGFYVNPLRDIHDLSSNGSNSHSIYYDLDSHEIFFNTSLTTNNSTGTSLVLGAGASSTTGDQIVLQSGNQVVNAPNNSGFFVNPVRDISSGSGLMEVRYNHSTNEFIYISSSGTVHNSSS